MPKRGLADAAIEAGPTIQCDTRPGSMGRAHVAGSCRNPSLWAPHRSLRTHPCLAPSPEADNAHDTEDEHGDQQDDNGFHQNWFIATLDTRRLNHYAEMKRLDHAVVHRHTILRRCKRLLKSFELGRTDGASCLQQCPAHTFCAWRCGERTNPRVVSAGKEAAEYASEVYNCCGGRILRVIHVARRTGTTLPTGVERKVVPEGGQLLVA
eukprot:scaffold174029_cov36-Tisochrysis_lutea.AAC.2